ncbi:unnamed protein product [Amoebophrya sp. A25]|nr:unnamed protein product [Amoebophrya sp. A25]|eukprot:GSA25T00003805001.1
MVVATLAVTQPSILGPPSLDWTWLERWRSSGSLRGSQALLMGEQSSSASSTSVPAVLPPGFHRPRGNIRGGTTTGTGTVAHTTGSTMFLDPESGAAPTPSVSSVGVSAAGFSKTKTKMIPSSFLTTTSEPLEERTLFQLPPRPSRGRIRLLRTSTKLANVRTTRTFTTSEISTSSSSTTRIPFPTSFAAYNADKFIPLTRFRQQHRRTEDGRLCAAAFIQDQQPFTNCTDIAAPTANAENVVGREWCYVEAQVMNEPVNGKMLPSWGYCQPVPDYDDMRHDLDTENLAAADLPEGVELSDAEMDAAGEKAAQAAAM